MRMEIWYARSAVLHWFRTYGRHLALIVLASLAVLGSSVAVPHDDDCHDHGCVPAYVEHDAAAHRFQAAPDASHGHPLHCVACHWSRTFRPWLEAAFLTAPVAERQPRTRIEIVSAPRFVLAALPPLRSPPLA
jgi:hypothetical protein